MSIISGAPLRLDFLAMALVEDACPRLGTARVFLFRDAFFKLIEVELCRP